tara:strand:+ start:11294 stop:11539 length:246 start_codon:yes stop_codon:yes gene_type:complete
MQKIINVLSVASFVVSTSIVGTGIFIYANKDAIIESAKEKIMKEVGSLAGNAVKDMIPSTPALPTKTGPVVPGVGLGIPNF